jgi:dTDP-4-amino-4,6-dideoxygalactose transaminase
MNAKLAVDGGPPVRSRPMPPRALIGPEEKAAAMAVFDEAIATGNAFGYDGPREQQYEREFAAFMGGGFADGVNSGTNALYCALGGLHLDALSEVVVPPITDPGGVMPVALLGCVPVCADADPRSFNTSAEHIAAVLTERTRAIVVAHIAGEACDMDPIMELARSRGLPVVEDCAQAHGATYKGRLVGTIGDIAAFSTMFGKHHCTGGQGGVVYTRDEALHWRARRFADRGKPFNMESPGNVVAGLNCNLNDLSAAIGSVQLRKLPGIIEGRRRVGEAVRDGLGRLRTVRMGWQVPDSHGTYWFLRLYLDLAALRVDKARFCAALAAEGIPAGADYRHIPAEAPWFRNRAVFGRSGFPWTCSDYRGPRTPHPGLPNAVRAVETHFTVAMHENYGPPEVADILAALEKVEAACIR